MKYETILNNNYLDNFSKLKYGFLNKDNELKNFKKDIKETKKYEIGNIQSVKQISGIYEDLQKLQNYINKLPRYSFAIWVKFKLQAPYFSSDDDEFYIIQNPCLKDKAFKVPMVRGSGWKGAIAKAGKDLINEDTRWFSSYLRVFGTGSNEYRKLIESLEKDKKITEVLINYLLFELGKKLEEQDIKKIKNEPEEYLKKLNENFTCNNIKKTPYLNIHKGRAIFYPTFFNRLSLEIINPHDRKTRAGTNPIHYEVVPKESEGILQLVYIPFDGILENDNKIKNEAKQDLKFLQECIKRAFENGIGAKTKLGWGRAVIKEEDNNITVIWSKR